MKRQRISILFLSVVLFIACTEKEPSPDPAGPEYISVDPEVDTRLTDNRFDSGDTIGVFAVAYSDDNTTAGDLDDAYSVNVPYLYTGGQWTAPFGPIVWPVDRSYVDLYAYYPYDETLVAEESEAYPFSVRTDQSSAGALEASDFLWAFRERVTPTVNPVELVFGHRMSKINVNIVTELDELLPYIESAAAYVTNTVTDAVVNLSDGSVTTPSTSSTAPITLRQRSDTATGYNLGFEGIVVPQTLGLNTPVIRIVVDGTDYSYRLEEELTLREGYLTTFNITISEIGLSVSITTIDDWLADGEFTGEIGTPAGRIIDLTAIDWSESWIHRVYDGSVQIAQVCREYISGTADIQAVVIYPYTTGGEPDLSYGYVARVMNRTVNSTTNDYDPNTSAVHGGQVSFTSSNTLGSYTAGTEELVNKAEIVGPGEVVRAADNSVALLTTQPFVVTDIDSNSYPAVKIGTQYWMQSNLKVEHFNDGTDLTYYYYNDSIVNKNLYGGLYPWDVVGDSRGMCPDGWSVPIYDEITSLVSYLGSTPGRKLKANRLWSNLNYNDNITGFTALPAGRRTDAGTYNERYQYAQYWQNTASGANDAQRFYLDYGNNDIHRTTLNKAYTQSVRCLRD